MLSGRPGPQALAGRDYRARYSSSAERLMRNDAPIFFAVSSPDSMIESTSCSGTPRSLATSAGAGAGNRAAVQPAAPALGRRRAEALLLDHLLRIERPTAISVAMLPAPPPFSMPWAIWNFT